MEGDGIVFAARASNAGKADPFPFDTIKSLRGTQWNSSSNTFTVKEAYGLYFMSLCVTPVNGQKAGYALMLSENTFGGITRKSTASQDRDVISHDFMIRLYAGETLHISNEYDTYGYPIHLDTSLSIFSISHSMTNDRVAFSVANEQTVIGFLEPFPFTNYLYNDGLHYDIIGNTFTAPMLAFTTLVSRSVWWLEELQDSYFIRMVLLLQVSKEMQQHITVMTQLAEA